MKKEKPKLTRSQKKLKIKKNAVWGVVVTLVLLRSLIAPYCLPHDPCNQCPSHETAPSPEHPFGTDNLGRDVLSRLLAGARTYFATIMLVIISFM